MDLDYTIRPGWVLWIRTGRNQPSGNQTLLWKATKMVSIFKSSSINGPCSSIFQSYVYWVSPWPFPRGSQILTPGLFEPWKQSWQRHWASRRVWVMIGSYWIKKQGGTGWKGKNCSACSATQVDETLVDCRLQREPNCNRWNAGLTDFWDIDIEKYLKVPFVNY